MELFNVAYIFSCGLFVLLSVISNTCAVPLSRIISDSLRHREDSSSSLLSPHRNNLGPMTQETLGEIGTPSTVFPLAGNTPSTQLADSPRNRVLRLLRSSVLRSRRQAEANEQCVVSPNVPVVEASDLETLLNATTFLGLNPDHPQDLTVDDNQPDQCPSLHNPWWGDRVEENLRSTCPWRWEVASVSEMLEAQGEFYPSHVKQARCLCQTCVTANIMGCNELRQPVTVFQKIGCKNGLAVMMKKTVDVTVGCYCQKPAPNGVTTQGTAFPDLGGLPFDS